MIHRLHTLSVRDQAAWIRHQHPTFVTIASNQELRSTGSLQPTPTSRMYHVMILYKGGKRPAAYVDGLCTRADAQRIPHTYAPNRPCLFYPPGREWRSDMTIARSIIPWLSLWLYYYEVWLATGKWEGGGVSHEPELENDDVSHS
jgi:hypothetical protein